jgi:HYR domain-containing protein
MRGCMAPTMKRVALLALGAGVLLSGSAALAVEGGASDESAPRQVLATANIFGAGYSSAPSPGGGGGGTLPPGWRLPAGSNRMVTFPRVTGTVTGIETAPTNGPEGNGKGPTDVESWQGISGIVDAHNAMFLVGVFLGDAEPSLPAPSRLDFSGTERFDSIAPAVGQTFFIGNGVGRRFVVPDGATRLFVGFADAFFWVGMPGYYGNNSGHLDVVVAGVLDGPSFRVDTTPPQLSGAQNRTVKVRRPAKRARVRFAVFAYDAVDGVVRVNCKPRSGSLFKLGRTTVACSATDASGNAAEKRFVVRVRRV